jgi:ADP-dependent NAD(P)H-hydrate dehydratase
LFVLGIADGSRRQESLRAVLDSAKTADAVLIGPGMRDTDAIRALLPKLLEIEQLRAVIIDASALALAGEFLPGRTKAETIITPHVAEMTSLAKVTEDEIQRNPLRVARETAGRFGSVVVLKGSETLICSAEGPAYLNKAGNVGLATAGSGDVLAGIVVGLCARGVEPMQAAVYAVFTHARAGEVLARRVGSLGFLAREIPGEIPRLLHP